MTPEDRQFVLQQMEFYVQELMLHKTVPTILASGMMNILNEVVTSRLDPPQEPVPPPGTQ